MANSRFLDLQRRPLSFFRAYRSTDYAFTTIVTVPFNVQAVADSPFYSYSTSTGLLTFNFAGWVLLLCNISVYVTSGSTISQAQFYAELNSSQIPGSVTGLTLRQVNHGNAAGFSIPLNVAVNDVARIRIARTVGTNSVSIRANGATFGALRIA